MLKTHVKICATAVSSLVCTIALAGPVQDNHGLTDLIDRLGAGNEPTGAGVEVAQVEAGASNEYAPDTDHLHS